MKCVLVVHATLHASGAMLATSSYSGGGCTYAGAAGSTCGVAACGGGSIVAGCGGHCVCGGGALSGATGDTGLGVEVIVGGIGSGH